MILTFCVFYDIKALANTRAALTLHQKENKPIPSQDKRTRACSLFQAGASHEPRAKTQPSKNTSQSLIAYDTCKVYKNKSNHEMTPFRPLSINAQKSCCSRTTYQNELKKTQGTNACNNIVFLDVPYRFPKKPQNHTLG